MGRLKRKPQWSGGPAHSEAVKRGMVRAKERYDSFYGTQQLRCWHCGEPFTYDGFTGRARQYCSNACRQAAYRERWG